MPLALCCDGGHNQTRNRCFGCSHYRFKASMFCNKTWPTHVYNNSLWEFCPYHSWRDQSGLRPSPCWEWQSKNFNKKTASHQDAETLNHARCPIGFRVTICTIPLNVEYLRFRCVPLDEGSSLQQGGKHPMRSEGEGKNYQIIEYWEAATASCNYNNLPSGKYLKQSVW